MPVLHGWANGNDPWYLPLTLVIRNGSHAVAVPTFGLTWHMDARNALDVARAQGWCAVKMDLDTFQRDAGALGLMAVPNRRGGNNRDVLRPLRREQAPVRSLSATFGLGPQPLHTDCAHHKDPPAFVVLASQAASTTPTLVWRPKLTQDWTELFQQGVFIVDDGPGRFLAPAMANSRIRFDPGCMRPCDGRARALVSALVSARHEAHRHQWSDAGTLLVIDNWRTLHARDTVTDPAERVIERITLRGGPAR